MTGSDRATRRRGLRRSRDPASFRFGPDLRRARERSDLSLETIQDRTGIRRFDIEALEDGDLSRFPDEKAALVAVRRCAEILGLDAALMMQCVREQWPSAAESRTPALVGAASGPGTTGRTGTTRTTRTNRVAPPPTTGVTPMVSPDTGVVAPVSGHLSRYPGDVSHLKAFTQTAQVPQVSARPAAAAALPPGLRFDTTDSVPVTWRGSRDRGPAPLALQVAVWSTVLLLALGVAGLAVHHWRPAWLAKIHLLSTGSGPGGSHPTATSATTVPPHLVVETATGPRAATVAVRASVFEVVVTTQAPCWIQVTSPASFTPLFSSTVPAGTTKTFTSTNGQLSVELGASRATVTAQILDKTIPYWSLTPQSTPYVITFHSAPT